MAQTVLALLFLVRMPRACMALRLRRGGVLEGSLLLLPLRRRSGRLVLAGREGPRLGACLAGGANERVMAVLLLLISHASV